MKKLKARDFFIFSESQLAKHQRSSKQLLELRNLLDEFDIDYDLCADEFSIIQKIFLADIQEYEIHSKTRHNEYQREISDLGHWNRLIDPKTRISQLRINGLNFQSRLFFNGVQRLLCDFGFPHGFHVNRPTKPLGLNAYLLTHEHMKSFRRFLSNFPAANAKKNKFVEKFLAIILPNGPKVRQISKSKFK